ncbi:MAG: DUF2189 domain-containing protein [Methylotenera sp.]|nr:DUF2189 domain-containing protein [Methylotenera sp.]MDP2102490.1 DUF2189 domain-containing protein [Methylotenera sp.]MDP2280195.1 DUF2189 domain-containing protein [Methylotenera sp.]MDP2402601.1 DUF2189 domain-containing protein [Methylotenera sp.]MDP3059179.1 DUF2189 domain-containing protein [Methylotenera sp.]
MNKNDISVINETTGSFPAIRQVQASVILDWLHAGVEDAHRGGWASLFYGFVFTVTGLLIHIVYAEHYWLLAGLTTGFFLLGPFLAIGLYDLSRRMEHGETPSLIPTLTAWHTNLLNIFLFALLLLAILLIWTLISLSLFSHFFNGALPTFTDVAINVFTLKQPTFAFIYFSVGGIFAIFVYAISVVAIPLMLDCKVNAVTAALVSLRACARNPVVMLLWALCIVVLVGVGLATSFLGLFLTMPIVGHASWHVYRDLIETNR